jgi:hypothetical protein
VNVTIILFTRSQPNVLSGEMLQQGFIVFKALAISEVFALLEEHPAAQIIISAGVDDERARVIQQHYPTMRLKEDTTLKDVLWDLELFFSERR